MNFKIKIKILNYNHQNPTNELRHFPIDGIARAESLS